MPLIETTIRFKKLSPDAKVPTRKFSGDAGLDIYALETTYILGSEQAILRTGIVLANAPPNSVIQVWPKSGLDARLSLHTGAGIIDPNYRGEILILLKNMSKHSVVIESGDAIAQLIIIPCLRPQVEVTENIEITDRNIEGGIAEIAKLSASL